MTTPRDNCWQCGAPPLGSLEHDGRAARWRCRIRLYDETQPAEPQADSDPELDADKPGTVICVGLRGVVAELYQVAMQFHGTPHLAGLEPAHLESKIPGLRPTLSRRGGNACWRLKYKTPRGNDWTARVDMERIEPDAPVPEIPKFRRPA
jgi:hypothetical protein